MIRFHSFTFSGDTFYRNKTVLPLGTTGLVFLRGRNLDGVSNDNLSNGTGKTRLAQLLKGFIFGESERGKFKRMVTAKFKGELVFEDTRTATTWSFTYDAKEAKDKQWAILENGNPRFVSHKPSDCQAFLQSKIGITQDEWDYFLSIDQNSIRTLLKGKPAERRLYLESFFNIDSFYTENKEKYDGIVDSLKDQINLMNQEKAKLELVKQDMAKLPTSEWLDCQLDLITSSLPWVRQKKEETEEQLRDILEKRSVWQEYQNICNEFSSEPSVPSSKELRTQLEELFQRQAKIRESVAAKKTLERLLETELEPHDSRQPEAPEESPDQDEPDVKMLTDKSMAVSTMRDKIKSKKRLQIALEALQAIEMPDVTLEDAKAVVDRLVKETAEVSFHINLLKEGGEHGLCPKCGQSLPALKDATDVKSAMTDLVSQKTEMIAEMAAYKDILKVYDEQLRMAKEVESLQEKFDEYPKFGTKLSVAEAELEEMNALSEQWKQWKAVNKRYEGWTAKRAEIMARANALGYPDRLEENFSEEAAAINESITEVQFRMENASRHEELSEILLDYPTATKLDQLTVVAQEDVEEWQSRIESLNVLKGDLSSQQKTVKGYEEYVSEFETRLAEFDSLQREFRISSAMSKFFAPAGFKTYELKKRCGLLIDRANYWSSAFFQEPYVWSLPPEVDDLDFLVRPVNHPEVEPYSAGDLSGGESNRASRVLLFAQLQLMPPNKGSNLLIVDEIEDKLDEAGVIAFTEEVIPKLKETFPDKTVVLISHQKGLKTSDAIDHLWLAERKNRVTTLKTYPFYKNRKEVV